MLDLCTCRLVMSRRVSYLGVILVGVSKVEDRIGIDERDELDSLPG